MPALELQRQTRALNFLSVHRSKRDLIALIPSDNFELAEGFFFVAAGQARRQRDKERLEERAFTPGTHYSCTGEQYFGSLKYTVWDWNTLKNVTNVLCSAPLHVVYY